MKFVLDGMLGKLTRWLRILGQNVEYATASADETLIEIAETEKRVLLTRDVELCRRAANRHVEVFLVEGENEAERLASLSTRYHLSLEFNPRISRCPMCNTKIRPTSKKELGCKIPPSTKASYQDFWECPKCGKVYWQGAHWRRITETLNEARKILEKGEARHSSPRSHLSGTS